MRRILKHLKTYVFRGLWAIVPIVFTLFVLNFLYVYIDQRVASLIGGFIGYTVPGLGIILLLIALYLLGLLLTNFIGSALLSWIERATNRLPLVKTTYRIGKQLSDTFSRPEEEVFRKVVLVEYLSADMWTIGFVTGSIVDMQRSGERLLKVYVPTPPNPTSGGILLVRESQTRDPQWSINEAMEMIISGGIIGPKEISASDKKGFPS